MGRWGKSSDTFANLGETVFSESVSDPKDSGSSSSTRSEGWLSRVSFGRGDIFSSNRVVSVEGHLSVDGIGTNGSGEQSQESCLGLLTLSSGSGGQVPALSGWSLDLEW